MGASACTSVRSEPARWAAAPGVDESGDLTWHTRTPLWGTTTWTRDATAYTPLRIPGQYFDPESGLHYNHFRYYEPESARYRSQDPLGRTPAPNPAKYVKTHRRGATREDSHRALSSKVECRINWQMNWQKPNVSE